MTNKNHRSLCVECVDLMDSSGSLMNLETKQHSVALASSVLVERRHYVLLRVCSESVCSVHQHNFTQTSRWILTVLGFD